MLTKLEKLGLRISAFIHEGALPGIDCSLCIEEGKQEDRNCAGDDRDDEVFFNPHIGGLTACPVLFIAPAVKDFLGRYRFIEKFPHTVSSYEDINPRLWEFIQYYDDCKVQAILYMREEGSQEGTESALNSIKNRFSKK